MRPRSQPGVSLLTVLAQAALLLVIGAALAGPAAAHTGEEIGGFAVGFHHPISGMDHVLAMVAVGMWGAQLGNPSLWMLPIAFPLVMTIGGVLGILGVPLPSVELGIALSVIVLGGMIALGARPPIAVSSLIVSVFAVFHGYAHGAELPGQTGAIEYSLGFVTATGCLHLAGILIGLVDKLPWGGRLLRVGGGGISLAGMVILFRLFSNN
jgi:urease accessory protein